MLWVSLPLNDAINSLKDNKFVHQSTKAECEFSGDQQIKRTLVVSLKPCSHQASIMIEL